MVLMPTDPIEGTWVPFKAELAGEYAPSLALEKMQLVIAAGTYAVHFGAEVTDSGSYRLHPAAGLHTITLVSECGANKGRTIPSIYQLVGDRLRICFGLDGVVPPAFAAPSGSRFYLVSYRRKQSAV